MSASERAVAQHCPYCGDTNLWPHEASHGAWECRDCGRVFSVTFLGLSGGAFAGRSHVASGGES